ncbi:MD-2-related lipid-recognition domain-containing protein [Entamoeba marina]
MRYNFFFLLSCFVFAFAAEIDTSPCCTFPLFSVEKTECSPWPPVSGVSLYTTFSGDLKEDVTELYLNVTFYMKVARFYVPVPIGRIELCNESIECPVSKGNLRFQSVTVIPPMTPSGTTWKAQYQIENKKGDIYGCVGFGDVKVK